MSNKVQYIFKEATLKKSNIENKTCHKQSRASFIPKVNIIQHNSATTMQCQTYFDKQINLRMSMFYTCVLTMV